MLAALGGGLLAHALRQPLIVGYILGGIAVGPFTPGPTVTDVRAFELFAEIGVVLLLFSAGVEFSIRELFRVRRVALLGGPAGIALTVLLTVGVGWLLRWPLAQSLVVGGAISVASTMVLIKFLQERGELGAPHGRVAVGITLVEDLAVVAMTILLPVLALGGEHRLALFGRGLLQAALLLIPLLWLARRVVPKVLARVARTRNMELFLMVTLAMAIGTATLTAGLGLSLALGAFLAGLVISESEFAHEALARILPVRDIFVAVFFVSIGTFVRPASLLAEAQVVVLLVVLITVGKFLVWSVIVRAAGYGARTAILAGLGLTQIGEFSYILAGLGRAQGLVSTAVYEAVLASSLLTILLNALLFRRVPSWLERRIAGLEPAREAPSAAVTASPRVVVCGFGRVGRGVADALDAFGLPYVVVDLDPEALRAARARRAGAVFGDAGNPAVLQRAAVDRAELLVVAIPEFQTAHRCVRAARQMRPDLPILARVHQERHRASMVEAGATEVIQPEVEAALTIVGHSLVRLGVDRPQVRHYLEQARSRWPGADEGDGPEPAGRLEAREIVIRSPQVADRPLWRARIPERTGAVVVSVVHEGREVINPEPEQPLRRGDRLLAIGSGDQLDRLERLCTDEGAE